MKYYQLPVSICITFLWIGFVCAISFMEAWIKFLAHGVTLPIGLSIGRLVFSALNKVEWVFAISILVEILWTKAKVFRLAFIAYYIPLLILIVQTWILLPQLDARAMLHIEHEVVPPSNLHFYYVGLETIKVICLFIFGIQLLNRPKETFHQ